MNIIILIILILMCIFVIYNTQKQHNAQNHYNTENQQYNKQLDQNFYDINDVEPALYKIHNKSQQIYNECMNVYYNGNWKDWPEKELYVKEGAWKIFPFYAFGIWAKENCLKCPTIYNFLKSIPNIKLATLSLLKPHTVLTPHRGWGKHSNHIVRCHYGLLVPDGCFISVCNNENPPLYNNPETNDFINNIKQSNLKDNALVQVNVEDTIEELQFHKQFNWLILDDSKVHYANNTSDFDRIVLIIDIERPEHIKTGISQVGDTKELNEIIKYYREQNIE